MELEKIAKGFQAYADELKAVTFFDNITSIAGFLSALEQYEAIGEKYQIFFDAEREIENARDQANDEDGPEYERECELADLTMAARQDLSKLYFATRTRQASWRAVAKKEFPEHQDLVDEASDDEYLDAKKCKIQNQCLMQWMSEAVESVKDFKSMGFAERLAYVAKQGVTE